MRSPSNAPFLEVRVSRSSFPTARCVTPGIVGPLTESNFAYHDGAKVNVVNFSELQDSGIYMVSSQFGFTVNYLNQAVLV